MQLFQKLESGRGDASPRHGFTLPELLVVLAVLGLLTVMLLPARADSRAKSKSIRCMDNLRELMGAVMMYTHDNHDYFPPNPDDGNVIPGHNWCPGQAGLGPSGTAQFNSDLLADPTRCLITTYINTNVSLFRCPADLRVGTYQGADPTKIGTQVPAARSISMNGAVGTICPGFDNGTGHSGKPTLSVNGPWLDNSHRHGRNSPYRTYGKTSEIMLPGPARLWVLIEEDVNSLNDANFAFGMNAPEWISYPATRHAMSSTVAFADGHVELHKWMNQDTRVISGNPGRRTVPQVPDWAWFSEHTTSR